EPVDPSFVRIGIHLEVPLHARLIDHAWPTPGPSIAHGTRVVCHEPAAGREVPHFVESRQKEPGPGHVAAKVVAPKPSQVKPPAPQEPSRPSPFMPKHDMAVDLIAAELKTEVIHIEFRIDDSQG